MLLSWVIESVVLMSRFNESVVLMSRFKESVVLMSCFDESVVLMSCVNESFWWVGHVNESFLCLLCTHEHSSELHSVNPEILQTQLLIWEDKQVAYLWEYLSVFFIMTQMNYYYLNYCPKRTNENRRFTLLSLWL